MSTIVKKQSRIDSLTAILKSRGILRVCELPKLGFSRSYLSELKKRGIAVRQARGVYMHVDTEIPSDHHMAVVCKKIPRGVICLLSALSWHEIGVAAPHEVWIAIDRKARLPKMDYPPVRIVRFSGNALSEGVLTSEAALSVRVYNPAKTVADCFKYRNKFGKDVAIEALREGWRKRLFTVDELTHYAGICRVENIMKPYLESVL